MSGKDLRAEMRDLIAGMQRRSEEPTFADGLRKLEAREPSLHDKRISAWRAIGIPEEHFEHLAAPDETDALAHVREFLSGEERILLLLGTAGRGKSVAACWGLSRVGGRYVRAYDVAAASYGDADQAWLATLRLARLAVIDEMAREPLDPKGWAYGRLYDLIDRRQAALRKTILIANVSTVEFKKRYCPDGNADPLYDRILNRGFVPKALCGRSMRADSGSEG